MKLPKRFVAYTLACALLGTQLMPAEASNISSIQQQINKNQSNLNLFFSLSSTPSALSLLISADRPLRSTSR